MYSLISVAPGVTLRERWEETEFESGSLRELALGLRHVLWGHLDRFQDADDVVVYIRGNQRLSDEDAVELEVPGYTATLPDQVAEELETVRQANLPSKDCARWPCDCDVYCDQPHGEGRLEFHIARPSFHELAASRTSQVSDVAAPKQAKDTEGESPNTLAEIPLRDGSIVRAGDTVRARGEDGRLRRCRIVAIFPEGGSMLALLSAPLPFGTVICDVAQILPSKRRQD